MMQLVLKVWTNYALLADVVNELSHTHRRKIMCHGIKNQHCLQCEIDDIQMNADVSVDDSIDFIIERMDDTDWYDAKEIRDYRKQLIELGRYVEVATPAKVLVMHNGRCIQSNRYEFSFKVGERFYVEV